MPLSAQKVPGIAALAFRTLDAWVLSRLMQIGLVEDELLNVVDFDGASDQTLSVHAATVADANPSQEWA